MRDFARKGAVVTGAASGIGKALAKRCAAEGMELCLADIAADSLNDFARELGNQGAVVHSRVCDVSKSDDVDALADFATKQIQKIHVLFNVAGVMHVAPIRDTTVADWTWVLGVNFWGVIHGVRAFLPTLASQAEGAHIVNVASTAGFSTGPGLAAYKVSKHGVVAFSEVLYHELAEQKSLVDVSVLCPGWVDTSIMDADRNRPEALKEDEHVVAEETLRHRERGRQAARAGMSPDAVAIATFEAMRARRFYILPHSDYKERFRARAECIMAGSNPRSTATLPLAPSGQDSGASSSRIAR